MPLRLVSGGGPYDRRNGGQHGRLGALLSRSDCLSQAQVVALGSGTVRCLCKLSALVAEGNLKELRVVPSRSLLPLQHDQSDPRGHFSEVVSAGNLSMEEAQRDDPEGFLATDGRRDVAWAGVTVAVRVARRLVGDSVDSFFLDIRRSVLDEVLREPRRPDQTRILGKVKPDPDEVAEYLDRDHVDHHGRGMSRHESRHNFPFPEPFDAPYHNVLCVRVARDWIISAVTVVHRNASLDNSADTVIVWPWIDLRSRTHQPLFPDVFEHPEREESRRIRHLEPRHLPLDMLLESVELIPGIAIGVRQQPQPTDLLQGCDRKEPQHPVGVDLV
ncbi:MAG TPA: hypothetical protein PLL54_00240 [Dermatophilaceae bacterium]|nr:hypothetical protein [Dermatophilaceae bacterium]